MRLQADEGLSQHDYLPTAACCYCCCSRKIIHGTMLTIYEAFGRLFGVKCQDCRRQPVRAAGRSLFFALLLGNRSGQPAGRCSSLCCCSLHSSFMFRAQFGLTRTQYTAACIHVYLVYTSKYIDDRRGGLVATLECYNVININVGQ